MAIISLTTDFGLEDGNVGVMKAVITKIAPQASLVDISHFVPPQDIFAGAFILGRSVPFFQENSIHLGVIDPGVGTQRRPIAARLGNHIFVGPDNGLCTLVWKTSQKQGLTNVFYHLDKPDYWLPEISHVFHGRDIFSPVAAHLANGVPIEELGTRIFDPILLEIAEPQKIKQGLLGEVIYLDHFGNIITNIMRTDVENSPLVSVKIHQHTIQGLVRTFGERLPGQLIALFGSSENLIISIVNGNAAQSKIFIRGTK